VSEIGKSLERIADALERQIVGTCNTRDQETGQLCVLDPFHVGDHVNRDGRVRWLEDE
jgi:hypothetical protein